MRRLAFVLLYAISVWATLDVASTLAAKVGIPATPVVILILLALAFCWSCLYINGVLQAMRGRFVMESHHSLLDDIMRAAANRSGDTQITKKEPTIVSELEYKAWVDWFWFRFREVRCFEDNRPVVQFRLALFGYKFPTISFIGRG
ncbi:hypothetical protein O152_gp179 [Pseudomonas phage PaBG]|uniref:Uncharacterized protein n=1 Tax=Pseudomonas phage PaBG TaxID=1335230 RepID=S5WBL4_9CAUD|nr:hypothetical protein O152_gp179 [Pseudomonas phage PaBG]AGS82178.1 hypothetical protein PaBG_00307 [Pseudomonas phage PaBG]